ncbi:MAG: dockerin type I repeat-containing protein, partial [Planctomycetota bacterium]
SDVDIYELTVDEPTRVEVNLTPVGGSYDQRIGGGASTTVQATRVGNLALEAQSAVAMLAESNLGGFGSNESLSFVATPGESYTVAVSGLVGATQLYRLDVATLALQTEGDYNGDGAADIADYTVWRDALLSSQTLAADGNGDGVINVQDYEVWRATFGVSASTLVRVPEPSALLMAAAIFPIFLPRRCRDLTGWL